MKKLIIHVGCGKAGSTSIQRALLECKELNQHLFSYPVIPNSPGNQVLRFAFCDVSDTPLNIKKRFSGEERKNEYIAYQEEIKSAFINECRNADTVVISSEFWFISSEDEVLRFKDFINSLGFSEVHIFMYLRDPAKYYLSVAQQALKNQAKLPSPFNFRYRMKEAISNWRVLEPDSFVVREFDRKKFLNGDVVADFREYLECFGISAKLELRRSLNETLTSEETQVIQDCFFYIENNHLDDNQINDLNYNIRKLIKNGGALGTKPNLREDISDIIYKNYMEEVHSLYSENNIFGSLVNKFSSKASSSVGWVFPSESLLFRDLVQEFDYSLYDDLKRSIFSSVTNHEET